MIFEEAARQHKRFEKVQEVLKLRDDLARDIDHLHGIAVTPPVAPDAVELWIVREGHWQPPADDSASRCRRASRSRLTETAGHPWPVAVRRLPARERQEYLALLARWFYSSWRDGEWLGIETFENLPYRKLVHAISRVARQSTTGSL